MDITFIAITFVLLLAIVFLLIFLSKSINTKSFKANDGSSFDSQYELDLYESLSIKTKPMFSDYEELSANQSILGFEKNFLILLNKGGFQDLKILIKYRDQIKLLSDLINS